MNLTLNPYRIFQVVTLAITWFFMSMNDYSYEANMLYANIGMLICSFLILFNSSITSVKFILSFILYSVALVPGAAWYIFGFKLYSYVNFEHQLNDIVSAYTIFLYYISYNIYTYIVLTTNKATYNRTVLTYTSRIPFYFLAVGVLVFSYLTESGGTLLTTGYQEIIEQRSGLMTLAGVALAAFWADMYGKYREYIVVNWKTRIWVFRIVTFLCITWLVLHARRTELIGFLSVMLIHQYMVTKKTPVKYLFLGVLFLFVLYFIGYTRIGAMNDIDVLGEVKRSLSPTFESTSQKIEFANMPSGLGNIAETMQTSVYHFHYKRNEFLNGQTIFSYPYKLIPSNLIAILDLPSTANFTYNQIVLDKYYYNGGTYILAPSYGNFGVIGLIIASIFFGWLTLWTERAFYSSNFLKIVVSTTVIFLFIKMVWYGFLPLTKSVFYNLLMLSIIALVFNNQIFKSKIHSKLEHA